MRHFGRFSNFDECRPEVAGDIESGVALGYVGMGVCEKFGYSMLNSGRTIRLWPSVPVLRTCVQYFIAFCSRLETASDVVSSKFVRPIIPDKPVKFRDPHLNRSRYIPPEIIVGDIFDGFAPANVIRIHRIFQCRYLQLL